MEKPDEKQPTTPTLPETQVLAVSSVVSADQVTASVRTERSDSGAAAGRPAPLLSLRSEIRVWTRDLLIAIGLALVIIVFLYQPVKVEGTSMAPLLSDQERIFINKFVYRFEPIQRGDVVVFWYPLDHSKSFIKRVVGLPGEAVEIRQGAVYVNGKIVPEPYVPPQYEDLSDFGPVRVPKDNYFVMGDHRISSNDSRVFGPVASRFIYGRAVFAYWPVDHFGSLSTTEANTQ
ncbi:MAG: signal peptidase I [Acidobacteria bacterium]|nr:MAG: signal peptidase I [Acidobacteriota bacterium]PYU64263.1 MAG: signal peptidase I [Acidobacteriota bacterium]